MKEKDIFVPCRYCSNVMTQDCFNDCVEGFEYKHFKLTPGTGIKDLPEYPLEEVLNYANPRFRLVVVSIYLAAITDYLQYKDEYEFRENAKGKKTNVPDLKFKSFFRSVDDGKNIHRTSSS